MNELMQAVLPFLESMQSLPSTSDIPITIDANPIVLSDTIAQDSLWDALEQVINRKKGAAPQLAGIQISRAPERTMRSNDKVYC